MSILAPSDISWCVIIPEARNDRTHQFGLTSTFLKINFYDSDFFSSKIFDMGFRQKNRCRFYIHVLHVIFKKRGVRQNAFVRSFGTSGTKLHKLHWREVRSANQSTKRNKTGKDIRFRCVPIGAEIFKIVRDMKGRAVMLYFKKGPRCDLWLIHRKPFGIEH